MNKKHFLTIETQHTSNGKQYLITDMKNGNVYAITYDYTHATAVIDALERVVC